MSRTQPVSLFDIAPRLAHARELWRWTHVPKDGGGVPGTEWAEPLRWTHETKRCRWCKAATADVFELHKRILTGCNKGTVTYMRSEKCRRCGNAWSEHR